MKKELKLFENVEVHCFKHSARVYRQWSKIKVVNPDQDFLVLVNTHAMIIEENNKIWWTKQPNICFFFKTNWFNVSAEIKQDGKVSYYCNIASPYYFENGIIKYIDYDLDVKVATDGTYRIMDRNEYAVNSQMFDYSPKLKKIIAAELDKLIDLIEKKQGPFNVNNVKYFYDYYLNEAKGM